MRFKPDIFFSFASPYAAQVSMLIRNPHIAFTDTEHAKLGNLAFSYFSKVILTPTCFDKNFGKKVVYIDFDDENIYSYFDEEMILILTFHLAFSNGMRYYLQ